MGNLLAGKKVGIIGFERIGQKVAELLSCFGCELSYFDNQDISEPSDIFKKVKRQEFMALLKKSDIVSVHYLN